MGCRDRFNSIPFWQLSVAVALAYGAYLGTSLTALVWMAVDTGRHAHALEYARGVICVVNGLHYSFIGLGFAFVDGYEYAPVGPLWLFLLGDLVQAGTFGAFLAAWGYDPEEIAVPIAACAVNVAVQFLCFYKFYVLRRDVLAGRRDAQTGHRYDKC